MTDRERLIELIVQGEQSCSDKDCAECEYINNDRILCDTYNLADYLLANGVIVPPCKVGQIVWLIRNGKIEETTVEKIVIKDGGLFLKLLCNSFYETTCRSIGKTVFLTREEAEAKLKELKG